MSNNELIWNLVYWWRQHIWNDVWLLFNYSFISLALDINECDSHSCEHGATCNDQVNKYTCTCAKGYIGKHCHRSELFVNVKFSISRYKKSDKVLEYKILSFNFCQTCSCYISVYCFVFCVYIPFRLSWISKKKINLILPEHKVKATATSLGCLFDLALLPKNLYLFFPLLEFDLFIIQTLMNVPVTHVRTTEPVLMVWINLLLQVLAALCVIQVSPCSTIISDF